ncbi:MAG: rhomboid family intramembrane serine protease [Huintestinicola sp.]
MKKLTLPRLSYNSPVILTYAIIAFAALILDLITGGKTNMLLFSVYRAPLSDPLFYFRLFGHVIGHSGIDHFVGNFMIILLVGPMLEEKYGSKKLLLMILFTALITGLINVIFFPTGLLGASGIAFMLILLSSFANNSSGQLPLTFVFVALFYLGGEILDGLFVQDNISQMAHIIGGGCGCVFGWAISRK